MILKEGNFFTIEGQTVLLFGTVIFKSKADCHFRTYFLYRESFCEPISLYFGISCLHNAYLWKNKECHKFNPIFCRERFSFSYVEEGGPMPQKNCDGTLRDSLLYSFA